MMGTMAQTLLQIAFVIAAAESMLACVGNPESSCVPQNPGSVVVRVQDQSAVPVANVRAEVGGIPNCVGSVYSVGRTTGGDGTTQLDGIDAGVRRVSITLPQGYAAGPDGVSRDVEVIRNRAVNVVFTIVRSLISPGNSAAAMPHSGSIALIKCHRGSVGGPRRVNKPSRELVFRECRARETRRDRHAVFCYRHARNDLLIQHRCDSESHSV
jgi:hypothetical protein